MAGVEEPELTRAGSSSREVERLRQWFDLPVSMLPTPRPGHRAALHGYMLAVNDLIAGELSAALPRARVAAHPPDLLAEIEDGFRLGFQPLWTREELVALRTEDAEAAGSCSR